MAFKNTIKLIVSNFSCFWKLVLYFFVALIITGILLLPIGKSVLPILKDCKLLECAKAFFVDVNVGNLQNFFVQVYDFLNSLILSVKTLFLTNIFNGIYFSLIIFIVFPLLINLAELPTSENSYGYMSSLSKIGFMNSYIKQFVKSLCLQLCKIIVSVTINLALIVGCYFIVKYMDSNDLLKVLIPLAISVVFCVTVSIKNTITCGFVPLSVVMDYKNPFKIVGKGLSVCWRRFFSTLSCYLVVCVIFYLATLVLGLYILIILFPLWFIYKQFLNMVVYYERCGMRYYVDNQTIISPKKFEEVDNFKKVKYVL